MIAGITPDPVTKSLLGITSTLYSPPSVAANQYSLATQFDAGRYLRSLFFSESQLTDLHPSPAYFVELNALSILKESLTPVQSDPGSLTNGLAGLLTGRQWPTDIQPPAQSNGSSLGSDTSALIGQLINTLA